MCQNLRCALEIKMTCQSKILLVQLILKWVWEGGREEGGEGREGKGSGEGEGGSELVGRFHMNFWCALEQQFQEGGGGGDVKKTFLGIKMVSQCHL